MMIMKNMLIAAAFAAVVMAGCSAPAPAENPVPTNNPPSTGAALQVGYALGSIKKGDNARCCVCSSDGKDHGEEAVADTIDYQGKTYAFCSESEKAEFISNPAKYTQK